ncbi:serine hydrolase [Nonomuraea sp. NPDC050556]|uniref:serine hydrolase n=1 Tax=Nonomuraea sp. NPDC050556 TaxID=3364369 RepID=UPI0037B2132A
MSELDLSAVFRAAGVAGWLHAVDLHTGDEVAYRADEPVVTASIFKVPLLVEFARQADSGVLDWAERVTVGDADRVTGPTGVSALLDDATLSLRDLAYFMITVSDNTAADVLAARVGLEAVNAMLTGFALGTTRVVQNVREMFAGMEEDAGHSWPFVNLDELASLRALNPATTNRSTARETTRLFGLIWADRAASSTACAWMRSLFGLQVWPHRLSSGFPYDDVAVSGKTGSLPTIRNEAGVVEYPDGRSYAVAVYTRAFSPALNQPRVDAVIGTAARMAVDHLRG